MGDRGGYNVVMEQWVPFIPIVIVVVVIAAAFLYGRHSYNAGTGCVVVRCREGHLFTTIWIPFISFKSIRFGPVRFQRCPVGDHLTFVTPVPDSDLTDGERRMAERYRDSSIP